MNVYVNGAPGSPFQMGGCRGCHGFQGQSQGGDMSVLIGAAGQNAQQAEFDRFARGDVHQNGYSPG